jgi:tetratricopeptide (TPR) repeat protein
MNQTLTALEVRQLQMAHGKLLEGAPDQAEQAVRAVLKARPGQADALHLLGLVLKKQKRLPEAREALEQSARAAQKNPQILNSLANLLGDMGEHDAAIRAYQASLKLDPDNAQCWTNLGLTALDADDAALAGRAFGRALQQDPKAGAAWCGLGLAHKQAGALEDAVAAFEKALAISPADDRSRYNLAIVLRLLGALPDAQAQLDKVQSLAGPEIDCARAELLADLGDFSAALALLNKTARASPLHLDAHASLARLIPQLDSCHSPLESYAQALAAEPSAEPLWRSAIASAMELKLYAQALAWIDRAEASLGGRPEWTMRRAGCLLMLGEIGPSEALLEGLQASGHEIASSASLLAWLKLKQRDFEAAARFAQQATRLAPGDQASWAYLATAWELMDHPRARWLADYDRLVQSLMLEPPARFSSIENFMAALAERLHQLHRLNHHPAEQSLRQGTQTRGNLLDWREPLFRSLAASIRAAVADALGRLIPDADHPFLGRLPKTGAITFSGSWSVRLRSEGFHISHIHSMGWMSSALYVALPPEVATPDAALTSPPPGALGFGVPDARLGIDLQPVRIVRPKVGLLAIFPSYFWHGTIPFRSDQARLTMAFDAQPSGLLRQP